LGGTSRYSPRSGRSNPTTGRTQDLPARAPWAAPLPFLPSTSTASEVDGNVDGNANFMDPEDAIMAAAGYLKEGGAPRDWYAALFYSYNHADWYVRRRSSLSPRLTGD
jgi:hypothetical protein